MVATGDTLVDAFTEAFPDRSHSKWVHKYAYKVAKDPRIRDQIELIQQAVRAQFVIAAPKAFQNLLDLADNAKGEKVKLQANVEILDRAGLKPPEKVEMLHVGIFGSASNEDIRSLIRGRIEGPENTKEDVV